MRKGKDLKSCNESELLAQMDASVPQELRVRYGQLVAKRREESLSQAEHGELVCLTHTIENDHARRLALLVNEISLPSPNTGIE